MDKAWINARKYSILFTLILVLMTALAPGIQEASAFSFHTNQNLSSDVGASNMHQVLATGSNVYVVWVANNDIFLRTSADNGASFASTIPISNNAGTSSSPQITASGSNVYVVWQDDTNSPGNDDIFFSRSTDSGATFSSPVNIRQNAADFFSSPRIAAVGTNVYVTWQEASGDIFFSRSTDSGANFDAAINISNSANASAPPNMAASGANVYIVWQEAFENIFFSRSTDSGANFDAAVDMTQNAGLGISELPQIAAAGVSVYIAWTTLDFNTFITDAIFVYSTDSGANFSAADNISDSINLVQSVRIVLSGTNVYLVYVDDDFVTQDVYVARSIDAGVNFGAHINLSNSAGVSSNPQINASGNNVFITWDDDSASLGTPDILLKASTDNGATFGGTIDISNDTGTATESRLSSASSDLYVIWQDSTPGNFDIFMKRVQDTGPPTITMNAPSSTTPRWGLDSVQVSGTANADNTDTVTIDWGDGTSTTGVAISGSAWGPVSHTYGSANTGSNSVIAKLIDQFSAERVASSAQTVNVQKHAIALTINPIMSVIKGADVTATGTLTDTDASVSLSGKTISFTGTGATSLSSVATASGSYSSTGASPGTASPLLTVQAHFAGDSAYLAADSATIAYDAVEPAAATFVVPAGAPSGPIALTGFGASILFDNVPASGSIFVSTCDSPASARYAELVSDTCLQISPAVEMASGTAAHITVSIDGKTLPPGRTAEEIGIFRESISGITEITESRDLAAKTVTGKTSGFSRFIVGVALHTATPAGAKAEQVFVGNNDITFDFTESRAISLSTNSITIGHAATISVSDPIANLNGSVQEIITARVTSTSDPTGISVTLQETGPNTSIFTGMFTVTRNPSSGTALHAESGNNVNASYQAMTTAPFRVVLTGVGEAGLAEVVSFDASDTVIPVGDAYALSLKDAQLSGSSTITLTMSYANAVLQGNDDPTQLRIVRMDGTDCEEVITPTLDTFQKTVTGTISTLGQYTIAFPGGSAPNTCPGVPGGGGGGLPRPGSGLVLDAVAVIVQGSSGGGSSGSTSSGSATSGTPSPQVSSNNASTTTNVGGETVSVGFESVQGTGSVSVTSMSVTRQAGLFSQVTGTGQGTGSVGGSQFSTAGTLFDIATSASYSGPVQITIPYNESLVSDEQNVRFLHYGPNGWEDATISLNAQSNTVTGQVMSLSPVVAGTVDDGTFGKTYFAANPTKKMAVMEAQLVDVLAGLAPADMTEAQMQKSLQAMIKNSQRGSQTFAFIVQVIDEKGFTQDVSWQTGELGMGESTVLSSSWTGQQGTYRVEMFVWTDISVPFALSEVVVRDVVI
jgi:hypothetical protein